MLLGTLTPSLNAALETWGPPRPEGLRECVGVEGWVAFAEDGDWERAGEEAVVRGGPFAQADFVGSWEAGIFGADAVTDLLILQDWFA